MIHLGILVGVPTGAKGGKYTWRHDQVLQVISEALK